MKEVITMLLTALVTYFFTRKQMDMSDKRKAYSEYLIGLQNYINNADFKLFQEVTNKMLLFASERTAKLVNQYFIYASTKSSISLSAKEHEKAHDEIIKSMRRDLGFIKNNVGRCALYRYDESMAKNTNKK